MNLYTLTRGDIPEATNSDYEEGTALCVMCIYVCVGGVLGREKQEGEPLTSCSSLSVMQENRSIRDQYELTWKPF